MKMRQIVGFAIFCGALGAMGGARVQAQTPAQINFAQTLLSRENRQIYQERVNIARQNQGVADRTLLTAGPATRRITQMINRLARSNSRLQTQIDSLAQRLLSQHAQVNLAVAPFSASSVFRTIANTNLAIITSFTRRPPFGIPPSSTIQ